MVEDQRTQRPVRDLGANRGYIRQHTLAGSRKALRVLDRQQGISKHKTEHTVRFEQDEANPLLSNITQSSGFRQFEQDRATVEWWKNKYEDVLGTPQGSSPLAVYPNPPFEG
jgi:hypothetical protein